jgi:hypothetical protein
MQLIFYGLRGTLPTFFVNRKNMLDIMPVMGKNSIELLY